MKLIKPKFWETKNFISLILYPLSVITYLTNITKKFSIKKNFKIKTKYAEILLSAYFVASKTSSEFLITIFLLNMRHMIIGKI